MNIAIVNPLRVTACGGQLKYLQQLCPRLIGARCGVGRLDVYLPLGVAATLGRPGFTISAYRDDDYYCGFRQLRQMVSEQNPDVVFIAAGRWVDVPGFTTIVKVSNIEPIQKVTYAASLFWHLRLKILAHEVMVACRRATRVIAVSSHVKNQLMTRMHIGGSKIDIVPHGANSLCDDRITKPPSLEGLRQPFIFTAGVLSPYRGLEDIFAAFQELRERGNAVPTVVIAGKSSSLGKFYEKRMQRLSFALDVADSVIWAGHLDRSSMAWCYDNCRAFVFTSRAEACPNIVLESMQHGCVSISTKREPMPEFYGECARYYEEGKASELARWLDWVRGATEAELSESRRKAIARAALFSWDMAAQKTVEIFRKAMAFGPNEG